MNSALEQESKSIPCHIQKIEKDFVHVAFDTANKIFTPPVVKMTQSFSRFGREPTQKKDRGLAVPGDYYLGGNTAFAGGGTNFYPRSNLASLSFQPLANLKAPTRDYDTHWETGGPNGWKAKVMEDQQEGQDQSGGDQSGTIAGMGNGGSSPAAAQLQRTHTRIMQQRMAILPSTITGVTGRSFNNMNPMAATDSSSQQQQDQQEQQQSQERKNDKTEFSFDKDGKALMRSKDENNFVTVDGKNKTITLKSSKIILDGTVYLGSKDANRPVSAKDTVDTAGEKDKSNFLTKVLGQ